MAPILALKSLAVKNFFHFLSTGIGLEQNVNAGGADFSRMVRRCQAKKFNKYTFFDRFFALDFVPETAKTKSARGKRKQEKSSKKFLTFLSRLAITETSEGQSRPRQFGDYYRV